jgi:hypothetical protein
MIRPTVSADTAILLALADGTRVFKPIEIVATSRAARAG